MQNVIGTYEILGAMCPTISESELQEIISGVDTEVKLVSNTDSEIHLTLPYYADLESVAESVSDSDIDGASVAGGEVFVTIALIAGAVVATAGSVTAAGVVLDKQNRGKDGKK